MEPRPPIRRDEVANRVSDLHAQDAKIAQIFSCRLPAGAAHTTNQSLDTEEIALQSLLREQRYEGAVAATEIDFDRSTAAEK